MKWFNDRADMDRWREEMEILEAEAERIPAWHLKTAENWTTLATRASASPGHTAYAYKQAAVHRCLERQFTLAWSRVVR